MLIYSDAKVEAIFFSTRITMISSVRGIIILSADRNVQSFTEKKIIFRRIGILWWITFSDGDIHNFGRFLRTFQSLEEAKAYAMYYANVNSGGINKKTILKQEEESRSKIMWTVLHITKHIRCIENIIKKFWMLSAKKTVSRIPAAEAVYICGRQF